MFGEINIPASGTGGRGDMRRTCGTTAAAGKAKAAKAAKVLACMSSHSFVQYNPAKAQILISNMLLVYLFPTNLSTCWCIGDNSSIFSLPRYVNCMPHPAKLSPLLSDS
jgi:hypothetical protein